MKKQQLNTIISIAEEMCARSGSRLTNKRKYILELLLVSDTPLSAYDVADKYNKTAEATMPAMSVYRILDFLESEQLVHKLSSANKYVACSHITCNHAHDVPQFLICNKCKNVKEIAIGKNIIDTLSHQAADAGYKLLNSPLELQCICANCLASTA